MFVCISCCYLPNHYGSFAHYLIITSNYSALPMFLQLQQLRRRLYVGLCLNRDFRVNFEMVQLNNTPSQYRHLSGLTDIFKSKLVSLFDNNKIVTFYIIFRMLKCTLLLNIVFLCTFCGYSYFRSSNLRIKLFYVFALDTAGNTGYIV